MDKFDTVVIGGGPAGTGLLFHAMKTGRLDEFLERGIAFVEKTDKLCCGTIGNYMIESDSAGSVFLECLAHPRPATPVNRDLHHIISMIMQRAHSSIPLKWVGHYLELLGNELKHVIEGCPASHFFEHSTALSVKKDAGGFLTKIKTSGEKELYIKSRAVVWAMGGRQAHGTIVRSTIAGHIPLKNYERKIMITDFLFTEPGIENAAELLRKKKNRKAVVIGGSHSALSSLLVLLNKLPGVDFDENEITLIHRGKLKLFYPSREEAWREGYYDFTEEDICPVSQKVNRLSGMRMESRDLLKKLLGINRKGEKRIRLVKIEPAGKNTSELKELLDEAALIIPAFGYRPRTIPLYDENDNTIELLCAGGGPLVDNYCRVRDAGGNFISGLYGIGLASGFLPWGKLGGEPSFRGQTNSLWAYQNGVGELIFEQLMESEGDVQRAA